MVFTLKETDYIFTFKLGTYMTNYPKISSYFTENSFTVEKNIIQKNGPLYVGHKLMVPNIDDYHVVNHLQNRYALVNRGNEYVLVSNVCPHRQSILLKGSGNTKVIKCGLHCWSFGIDGKFKGAPHFTEKVESKNLETIKLYEWNGLLFKNRIPDCDFKKVGLSELLNFDDYFYHSTESETYHFNWKSFMEIYLENYHVFSMHPGLKNFVKPSDLEWEIGADYSIQKVGMGSDLRKFGSEIYKTWQTEVLRAHDSELPRYGAIWMLIYPNIMIEWYPHVIVISTVDPKTPGSSINHVEFYYSKSLYQKNENYFKVEKEAYLETATEDNEACLLLEEGRRALYLNNEEIYGPIDSFLEKGVAEFYEYLFQARNSEFL